MTIADHPPRPFLNPESGRTRMFLSQILRRRGRWTLDIPVAAPCITAAERRLTHAAAGPLSSRERAA